jgi:hypothetical protein
LNVWGTVKVNGENVEPGTPVSGWCRGTFSDTFPAELAEGESWYSLAMPGDDPATTETVEGCQPGDTISFTIGGLPATQATTWKEGVEEQVNLTTTFGVDVVKEVSVDGLTWQDANTPPAYPEAEAGSELAWRITITNTSPITVTLAVTDKLDGAPLDVSSLCAPAPPANLSAVGEAGAWYLCQIPDLASAESHRNVVTATITYATYYATAVDGGGYVGGWPYTVYLPLVIR